MTTRTGRRAEWIAGVVLTACALCACGADAPDAAPTARALSPEEAPSFEALPDCDEMALLLGGLVDGLVPADGAESGQGKHGDSYTYGVSCTWLTPRTRSDNAFEAVKGGSLAVGITVSELPRDPDDEAIMRGMGMVFDDPRAEAIGGYVVTMDRSFDPAAPLGIVGPQVVIGPTTIIATAGGLYLGEVEELAPITNDRAIGASVALYEAIRER
ncbi:lytic murein transglycosylase [Marilutibacter spongiae]|uniref:Lytic murein transglycosylase n=1 Tax=Marilutibacter spongiae TaxID=2025720 RepID=A0A7W3TPA2_9GAMM|nr:lytic murein transglycosylase [Lysobacter spongiae]MBB1061734.1 lytic murein transglycosylase [Lysobacter spongiae]